MDKRLESEMEIDIRVTLAWDADMTNIELVVVEPNGDICNPFQNQTKCGGLLSKEFTRGYGPVEYLVIFFCFFLLFF